MAVTKQMVQQVLITRLGRVLTDLSFEIVLSGDLEYLEDPIGWGLRMIEISTADLSLVTNAEVASMSDDDVDEFLDYAEYRLIGNLVKNAPEVDVKIGHRSEEFSQLANRLIQMFDRKRTEIRQIYGFGLGGLTAGRIDLDSLTTSDDENVGI